MERCIQLLSVNPKAQDMDFLRIYAMLYALEKTELRISIISRCAELFDLKNLKELLKFTNWLVRIEAYESIIKYVPVS